MQKRVRFLFIVYILLVIKVTVFKYPYEQLYDITLAWSRNVILEGLGTANFVPFKTIKMYIKYADRLNSFENLAGNILVFVPFGILFPLIRTKRKKFLDVLLYAFVLVMGIEVFQLFSNFGAFDVDDIILNCFGAALGYIIYRLCLKLFTNLKEKERVGYSYGNYFKED